MPIQTTRLWPLASHCSEPFGWPTLFALLENSKVPKITETLKTLSAFVHNKTEHEKQFFESEYELHMAAQFVGHGRSVSFVETKAPSRYQQRVEFMLGYKWPVECKRPRSEQRILPNVKSAIGKLNERQQPGLICVGLEAALPMTGAYLETLEEQGIQRAVSSHLQQWLGDNKAALQAELQAGYARFLVATYTVRAFVHSSETIALPSLRLGLAASGEWINTNVAAQCLGELAAERARQTGN